MNRLLDILADRRNLALLLAANLAVVAFWSPAWFTYWQVPISCTIFICLLGVMLFDTLMHDDRR